MLEMTFFVSFQITIQSVEKIQKITTKEMLEMTFTSIDPRHAKPLTMVMVGIEEAIIGTNIGVEIEIRCILIRGMIILPMEIKTTKIIQLIIQLNRCLGGGVVDVALAATLQIVEPRGEILAQDYKNNSTDYSTKSLPWRRGGGRGSRRNSPNSRTSWRDTGSRLQK